MKKALIIAYNDLNNSGVPNVIYQTVKALHSEYIFDILIFKDDEYYYKKLQTEGFNVNLIRYEDKKPKSRFLKLFWWFHVMPKQHYDFAKKLLKEKEYSVIHSFKEYYSWPFFKAAKELGIKKRILHRNINRKYPRQLIIKLLEKKNRKLSIKYASNLVGVSKLSCEYAFKKNKYSVLYNCYDEDKYNLNIRNKLNSDELVVTQVASYGENKNQLFSLEVLKELLKLHKNTRLNLVGLNGKSLYFDRLLEYTKTNNLENYVSFIQKSDCVEKIYESTTFTILPSFSEGLPLTIIEAQACGIIVFASSNVTNEVNCGCVKFLHLDEGPEAWANYIYKTFMSNNNKRFECNVQKFSFKNFRSNLMLLYSDNN